MEGLGSRTIRSFGALGSARTAQRVMYLAVAVLLARLLAPEDFGIAGLALMFVTAIATWAQMGLYEAVVQRPDDTARVRGTAFVLALVFAAAGYALVLAAAPAVAWFRGDWRIWGATAVLGLMVFRAPFTLVPRARIARDLKFRRTVVPILASGSASAAVKVALAFALPLGLGFWAIVTGNLAGAIVAPVAYLLLSPALGLGRFDRRVAGELVRYGFYVSAAGFLTFLAVNLDNVVVWLVFGAGGFGEAALGYYLFAYSWASMVTLTVVNVAGEVLFPAYARVKDDPRRLRSGYLFSVRLLSLMALPAYAGLWIVAPDFAYEFLGGDKWMPAIPALKVLILMGAVRSFGGMGGVLRKAIGRVDVTAALTFVFVVGLVVLLVPAILLGHRLFDAGSGEVWGGLVGASATVLLMSVTTTGLGAWMNQRIVGVRVVDALRAASTAVLPTFVMTLAVLLARALCFRFGAPAYVRVFGAVAVGVAVYAAAALVFCRAEARELWQRLAEALRRPRGREDET
jgi:O-antigen/teichoic acid export membrane protein